MLGLIFQLGLIFGERVVLDLRPQLSPKFLLLSEVFLHYDSHSRKMEPRVSWMEKVGKEDPNYWVRNTQMARDTEEASRGDLETLRLRYNQSKSLHTWQRMYGCELRADGSRGGFDQYGYDGRTFLTFDKETLTWVAPDPQAQITKRKWDALPQDNHRDKSYLEEECIEWLERYLSYRNETLQSTGEHQGPGWTFLLYGWISCTHSDPLGSLVCSLLALKRILPLPSQHLSRMREVQFGSYCGQPLT
uniref:MHC class I-like antigen recognition-like domain-containing protein n=1 Tax=Naja naja TaxID=35670 RepID=A0A8C6Y7R1_NAJNA